MSRKNNRWRLTTDREQVSIAGFVTVVLIRLCKVFNLKPVAVTPNTPLLRDNNMFDTPYRPTSIVPVPLHLALAVFCYQRKGESGLHGVARSLYKYLFHVALMRVSRTLIASLYAIRVVVIECYVPPPPPPPTIPSKTTVQVDPLSDDKCLPVMLWLRCLQAHTDGSAKDPHS